MTEQVLVDAAAVHRGLIWGAFGVALAALVLAGVLLEAAGGQPDDAGRRADPRADAPALAHPAGAAGCRLPLAIFPAVNASLNATCGVLLVAGWVCIRRKRPVPHIACMVTALGVAALFLGSYLYYHAHHGVTTFRGEGWVRTAYFALLLSHTTLAAAVPFLALVTLLRGLRGQFERHRRIARWTLPLWLYVSVTGVVVYVMLYHIFPTPGGGA